MNVSKIQFSEMVNGFKTGIFATLNEKKEELIKEGRKVYNLSVGTPDFKPAPHVMKAMQDACKDPENYKYALADLPELLKAVQYRYEKRFGVRVETDEIMSVYGSQECMAHIGMVFCNPGDTILVPNPGYPMFEMSGIMAKANLEYYTIKEENGYLPDLDHIPEETLKRAKYMIVSYPLNPVCVAADDGMYERLIRFAEKYEIIILHDNAYSDIIYDGRKGGSFLAYEGAKDVGVEFYSLSKSYNLTGARISFVIGNKEIIRKFQTVRSQIDYGVFKPVQYGAIAALTGPQDGVISQCAEYERRNKALCGGLRRIGWNVPDSHGSMFVWAPIPAKYAKSMDFCLDLVEKSGVLCTPGSSFGPLGEGYVRFALTLPPERIAEAVQSIKASGILN